MSVLTKLALFDRLKDPEDDFKIMPLLDWQSQIGDGAINLRVGTKVILSKKTAYPLLCPGDIDERKIRKFHRRMNLCFGQTFIIHPQQFLLTSTFEFISMPSDLCGLVLTRSRYGRAGLIITTATYVHPNWRGCLTLELTNYGDVPLELTCGAQIGQLVLLEATPAVRVEDRKIIPVDPEFTTMDNDPEWKKLEAFQPREDRSSRFE